MKFAKIVKEVPSTPFKLGGYYRVHKQKARNSSTILLHFNETTVYQIPLEAVKL